MVLIALLCLVLASSQDFPTENKVEKFNACYYLTKLKVSVDKEELDSRVGKLANPEKGGNRITSDMLLKCYKTITLETALYVLQQGEELFYQDSFEPLVGIEWDLYEQGDYNLTAEHTLLYDEIKKIKEQAEEEAEKAPVPQPPLPPVGIWYIFVVIIIFAGFFYWASTKVLNKPQPKAKEIRNKKKN